MKVTIVQNSTAGGPGHLGDYLKARGGSLHSLVTYQHIVQTPFASLEADLVVILGSPRGVYEVGEDWIRREHQMVEHLLRRDIPIFGICFGAQLLATVLGGTVRPMGYSYHGWRINDAAPSDMWRGPWLRWHGDRIFLPATIEVMASESGVTQAFRYDRTLGVQFHPEATLDILRSWAQSLPDGERETAGDDALSYYDSHAFEIRTRSFALFDTVFQALLGSADDHLDGQETTATGAVESGT